MTAPLRVGVIGAGAIAQVAHLPMLSRSTEFDVVAIGDNDLSKARALAQRFDIPEVYDDIEYLLKYARPDVVAVCTPNHLHEVHVKTALAAGAHVLCERPLALGTAGVEAVIAAQQRADRAMLVGMHHRFRSDVQAVRQFLAGGELGAVHAVRAEWYTFKPARQALGWRLQRAQSGGGAMLDLGVGLIDLALWLLDWPKPCQAFAHFGPPDRGDAVEDSGIVLVSCDGGASIAVDVTWRYVGQTERVGFEVLGAAGSASIGPLAVFKELHGTPVNVTPTGLSEHTSTFNMAYASQWAHFAAMIRGDVERADLSEQLTLQHVMEGIYRSAHEAAPVQL
jgi:predicted dehydrogenase